MNSSEDDENEHENKAKPQPSQPRRRARYDNDSDDSYKNSSDGDDSDDGEWDKNTDDINSLATEELHRSRPNRWTGAASTWRSYTEQERRMHAALLGERRGDLSVHLYNAFAMRGRREVGLPFFSLFSFWGGLLMRLLGRGNGGGGSRCRRRQTQAAVA